jgi:hypothetical protein
MPRRRSSKTHQQPVTGIEHCEVCRKPARFHSCEIRDGNKTEHHLCEEHAAAGMGGFSVDQDIRQALSLCWSLMPADHRNVETAARVFRRLVERALDDFTEDAQAFGLGS